MLATSPRGRSHVAAWTQRERRDYQAKAEDDPCGCEDDQRAVDDDRLGEPEGPELPPGRGPGPVGVMVGHNVDAEVPDRLERARLWCRRNLALWRFVTGERRRQLAVLALRRVLGRRVLGRVLLRDICRLSSYMGGWWGPGAGWP